MRNFILLLALVTVVGCSQQPPPSNRFSLELRHVPKITGDPNFVAGYWDGFNGNWLAPIRWSTNPEYRRGYSMGKYDREHNVLRFTVD